MIYIQVSDLIRYIDNSKLLQIVSNDLNQLDGLERRSIDEMTGYLSVRYDAEKCFDANDRIPIVVDLLCDMVLYHAHARIMPDMIPELRKDRYKEAVNWLEKIADGFIAPTLPLKEDQPRGPLRYGNSTEKQDMYY